MLTSPAQRLQPRDMAFIVLLLGGAALSLWLALPFLAALVWAATLAVLFDGINRAITARLGAPGFAAMVTLLLAAGIAVVPAIAITGKLLDEAVRSATLIGPLLDADAFGRALGNHPRIAAALQWAETRIDLPDLLRRLTAWLTGWSSSVLRASFTGVLDLLLTFYFLFYFLRDGRSLLADVGGALPFATAEWDMLCRRAGDTIVATAFGTVAMAALQGGLGGLMFWWLGLPAPAFWGLLMGLLAIVPFLGAFVVWVPAAVLLALAGRYGAAALLAAWGMLVVGLVDNLVYPLLVGNRLRMHTVLSFIAVVGGVFTLGTPGIVLGPLIVALSLTLLQIHRARSAASA
jgi:predicted PurR-regulated permease PerM